MNPPNNLPAGILTVSDSSSAGTRTDVSGETLAVGLQAAGFTVVRREVVPDDALFIEAVLKEWSPVCRLIITTGGTGFAPRDVTPEATASVIERPAPGLAEYLRWNGYRVNPRAALSRGLAGIRGRALIVNFPGSPRAVEEYLAALQPLLEHALALIDQRPVDH